MSLIWILFAYIALCVTSINTVSPLFAGNGATTLVYYLFHNDPVEMSCTTNDDCYSLLCQFIDGPIELVVIKPNDWKGNCEVLRHTDNRHLAAELDAYTGNKFLNTTITKTVSDMSTALCYLHQNTNITEITYFRVSC